LLLRVDVAGIRTARAAHGDRGQADIIGRPHARHVEGPRGHRCHMPGLGHVGLGQDHRGIRQEAGHEAAAPGQGRRGCRPRGGGRRRRDRGPRGGRGGGRRRRGRGPRGGRGGGRRRRGRGPRGGRGGGRRRRGRGPCGGRGGRRRRRGRGPRGGRGGGRRRRGRGPRGGRGGGRRRRGRGPCGGRAGRQRRGRRRGSRRRDRQVEGPRRPAVPVDDDEVRLPRGHRRRDAGGAEQAGRVGAGVIVAPGRDLGPARAHPAPQVEDGVERGGRAARLDGRRARDRRGPLEDLL